MTRLLRSACCLLIIVGLTAWLSPTLRAQPDEGVTLGGTVQARFSYGHDASSASDRLGFGVRRARLRASAPLAGRLGAYMQLGAAGTAVELLDVYGYYQLTEAATLLLGRFTGPQPRAFQGTSHTRLDAVSRASIAQIWGGNTIGSDGRDFGLGLRHETPRHELSLALQNGDGSWSRLRGNFRDDVTGGLPHYGIDKTGLAINAHGTYKPASVPGLEVGGFASYNGSENPNTEPTGFSEGRTYFSYAGHLYWGARPGSQPVRLKADLIGIRFEEISQRPGEGQHTLGVSVLGAVRPAPASELFARYERYMPDLDDDAVPYLTAGGSFSLSALRGQPYRQQRLTLAYSARLPDGFSEADHLVVLQAQLVF